MKTRNKDGLGLGLGVDLGLGLSLGLSCTATRLSGREEGCHEAEDLKDLVHSGTHDHVGRAEVAPDGFSAKR